MREFRHLPPDVEVEGIGGAGCSERADIDDEQSSIAQQLLEDVGDVLSVGAQ